MITNAEQSDQLPPANVEAEAIVLASILMEPESFLEIRGVIKPDSFSDTDYKIIFESIVAVADAGQIPDLLSVRTHLKGKQLLDDIGGHKTLIRLAEETHYTARDISRYAAKVSEAAKLRELIRLCDQTRNRCFAPTIVVDPAEKIAVELERAAAMVREIGWIDSIRSLEQIAHAVYESKGAKAVERIKTGLTDLDELIGGIPLAGMTLIAGKASMGKSQLCKQIARNVAEGGDPVGIVAIEESAQKIGENYFAGFSGIENSKIVYNRLAPEDFTELGAALPRMSSLKLYVDDAQQKLSDISRTVRRMVRRYGCRMVIVDHLHLIDAEMDTNRVQQITIISGGLKKLFKELKIAGIAAAQMNRGGAADQDSPPELWNLRDSGSLEQDGDLIMQLHRPDYYEWKKQGERFQPTHQLRIFVNKNKAGGVGWRDTYFDGDAQMVTDWNEGRGPNQLEDPFGPSLIQLTATGGL